jgi:predicted TPR repeat methyltransferase
LLTDTEDERQIMVQRKEIHDRVLAATSTDELMAVYGEWAELYDHDLIDELGYVAPVMAATVLQQHLTMAEPAILDAGCGTGLVGEVLHREGFTRLDGLDYSTEMLARAEQKKIYGTLLHEDMTGPLDIADDRYDAVISVGTFTCGHVGPTGLYELVRITKPSGLICFTVREQAWQEDDYRRVLTDLQTQKRWQQRELRPAPYIQDEGSTCMIGCFQVLD